MLYEIKVLLDQTAPLERAGQWQSALDVCREAFKRSVSEQDVGNLLESVLRAGLVYRQMGERDSAEEYLGLAVSIARNHRDYGRLGRALNGLATVHHMHGELASAEGYYREARNRAVIAGDHVTTGYIDQNLGTLAVIRGNVPEALRHYRSALASHRKIANPRGISGVLNNLAMLSIGMGHLDEADRCLAEALEVALSTNDVVTVGIVHINRTELFLARGALAEARTSCDEAFEIVSRLREHANRSDVLKLYGIIYRESQRYYLAETHLREAIEIAASHRYPLEEAQAQRELALVLRAQDRNREALEALNRAHELFTSLQAEQYQADIARRVDQLQDDFLALVRSWGESIEAKDRYTSGHCERVADYACRIAKTVGLTARELVWFRMGAFLHDVGKTEVPGDILNKPGRLTDVEREIIEHHTVSGDEMLSLIPFPWDIRPMVRSHHERWDGRGYPDQLKGSDIPLTARILRIADVFDALTTNRSYRQPLTPEQALQIMQDDYGSFDPDLFGIFQSLFGEFSAMVPAHDARHSEFDPK
jgi:putative nucleotidyltransferase with HDIG domain